MVVFLGAVIPILINTQAGVKTSEARFIRVARSFSASKTKIFCSIILPGTVPFIFTGLKYGAGRALLGVVVGELIRRHELHAKALLVEGAHVQKAEIGAAATTGAQHPGADGE
jgi:ABC-type nitrate/sulfonate/bicarbonate transport system, permease component